MALPRPAPAPVRTIVPLGASMVLHQRAVYICMRHTYICSTPASPIRPSATCSYCPVSAHLRTQLHRRHVVFSLHLIAMETTPGGPSCQPAAYGFCDTNSRNTANKELRIDCDLTSPSEANNTSVCTQPWIIIPPGPCNITRALPGCPPSVVYPRRILR